MMPFEDTLLSGLAEELKDFGLTVSFTSTSEEPHSSISVYTTGVAGKIARVNIFCYDGKFVVQDSCGEYRMAGKLEFELADPKVISDILQYINRRIWHWTQIEQIFA